MGGKFVGVELASARVLADFFVHQRLGQRRGVLLVVAELAKADDVHDDIFVELLAVVECQLGGEHNGFGVVAIDVQDGRFNHLDHV